MFEGFVRAEVLAIVALCIFNISFVIANRYGPSIKNLLINFKNNPKKSLTNLTSKIKDLLFYKYAQIKNSLSYKYINIKILLSEWCNYIKKSSFSCYRALVNFKNNPKESLFFGCFVCLIFLIDLWLKLVKYVYIPLVNLKNDFKESLSDPLYRVFFTIYFSQGALGIAGIAFPLYIRDIIGLSVSQVATLQSLTVIPWLIKPLYGLISDKCPIAGLRRKSYILLCSALGFLGWFLFADVATTYFTIFFAMFLANLGLAATDVVCDGLAVQISTAETREKIQAICWRSRSIGALITGVAGGMLLYEKIDGVKKIIDAVTYKNVFEITMILPLFVMLIGVFILEEKVRTKPSIGSVLTGLDELFRAFATNTGSLTESYFTIKNFLAKSKIRIVSAFGLVAILALIFYGWFGSFISTQAGSSVAMYWTITAIALTTSIISSLFLIIVGYTAVKYHKACSNALSYSFNYVLFGFIGIIAPFFYIPLAITIYPYAILSDPFVVVTFFLLFMLVIFSPFLTEAGYRLKNYLANKYLKCEILSLQPKNWELILAAIFIFIWNLTPAFGTPFLFFMREGLGFDTRLLGILSSVGSAGAVVGTTIYKNKLTKVRLKKILRVTIWLGFFMTLAMLVVLNKETAMIIFFVSGVLGYIGFVPTMALAAKACPKNVEASVFALLMSVANGSGALATYIGGQLYDGYGLKKLILISAISGLAALPLIRFLREEETEDKT